ncbi:hypothetical protein SAMN05444392_10543 [Seinonella peptonophila]|uniref:Uncharacterized protein n=1 Tax=Seinonella peptonophila TaxID=112248 RepID=A0A1M4XKX7_9BACL|nr:hypothetical protein [Seinonella peptonophila]SHE93842.1 hypothetical protein SAMN05444392_10543 [Seinonella peptonophila]
MEQVLQLLKKVNSRLDQIEQRMVTKDDIANLATKDDVQMLLTAITALSETQGQTHQVLNLTDKRLKKIESSS